MKNSAIVKDFTRILQLHIKYGFIERLPMQMHYKTGTAQLIISGFFC